jgi:AbiU2
MGATAGMFFGDLNQMLKEYIILQACKITDPAHDVHNNDNHTIAFLLERYDFSSDPSISKRLTDLLASIRAFRDKLRSARNKLISHLDRDTILAGRPLGVATDEDWNQFWLGVAGRSDAGDLLKALKRPVRYPT